MKIRFLVLYVLCFATACFANDIETLIKAKKIEIKIDELTEHIRTSPRINGEELLPQIDNLRQQLRELGQREIRNTDTGGNPH